jgi:hypothetical protein
LGQALRMLEAPAYAKLEAGKSISAKMDVSGTM